MKIFFNDKKIAELCAKQASRKKLGIKCAKVLEQRLLVLKATKVLGDCKQGNPHPLKGDKKGQFAMNLEGGYRLVFTAKNPVPTTKDGATDWKKVKEITIIFIGDYHE